MVKEFASGISKAFTTGVIIFCLSACSKDPILTPPDTPNNDEKVQQKEIIAKLSGKDTIVDGYALPGRTAEVDKIKVRVYLKELIGLLSLQASQHEYVGAGGKVGANIYSILPATVSSSEYIIVGAHYDSFLGVPGANDNASGVAVVFGLIKNLKKVSVRNKNILFVFFDDEELGLFGSAKFAEKILQDGLNVHSVHTVDQMGWDNDGDRAIELELPTDSLKAKYQAIALANNIPIHITNTVTSDHSSFRRLGFKAIGLTEEYRNGDTTPYYHQATDTYETINFDYLLSSTLFMSKVIESIAAE